MGNSPKQAKVAPAPSIKPTHGNTHFAPMTLISHPKPCELCATHGDPGLLTFPCGHAYDLHCYKTYAWMNDLGFCVACRITNPANLSKVLDLIYRCAHSHHDGDPALPCHYYDACITGRDRHGIALNPMYYSFEHDRWLAALPLRKAWP